MALWPQTATIWVSPETAIKMQQSGEGIKLIRPSYEKWEQKWSEPTFSFVFLGNYFVNFGGSSYIYIALDKLPKSNSTLCEIHDRLMLIKSGGWVHVTHLSGISVLGIASKQVLEIFAIC